MCRTVRRVDPRDEGVAEVALRRWRIVLRLGRYTTTRDGAADICFEFIQSSYVIQQN